MAGGRARRSGGAVRPALTTVAVVAAAVVAVTVATRDPEDAQSVATVVVAFTILVAALAIRLIDVATPHRRRAAGIEAAAFRRGSIVGLIAGGLALLRVVDGLTPITAAFLVIAFAGAEYVLAGQGVRSRR